MYITYYNVIHAKYMLYKQETGLAGQGMEQRNWSQNVKYSDSASTYC